MVVPGLGALYGSAYFPAAHRAARRTRVAYGVLPAAMIGVVVARDAVVLLVAWELMALSAFVLVCADDDVPAVRTSSWIYLAASHLGTLALIAAFCLLSRHTGDFALRPATGLGAQEAAPMAVLFLVGFGLKAGVVPLHVWLPGAHANAPSHVSAVMSGVVLKMGLYGLMRASALLPDLPVEAGGTLLALGAFGAVGGAALAAVQSDVKRLLAYSSIDNMGIVMMGLGLALCGRANGQPGLVALGLAGATLHAWNHSLFKPLMFFAAGSVIHATGTRDLNRLGGLSRSLPRTAGAALVGAAALAGLPPLNGFVGELVLYVVAFRAAGAAGWPALAAPALAVTGALAVLAMAKVYGGAFLGTPRDDTVTPSHADEPWAMILTMRVLAVACLVAALGAPFAVPWLVGVVGVVAPGTSTAALRELPLGTCSAVLAGLVAAVGLAGLCARAAGRLRPGRVTAAGTWDCGYVAPTARLQYTASSFSDGAGLLFGRLVRPDGAPPREDVLWPLRGARRPGEAAQEVPVLPGPARYTETLLDPVWDRLVLPALRAGSRLRPRLHRLRRAQLQTSILLILVAVVLLMLVH